MSVHLICKHFSHMNIELLHYCLSCSLSFVVRGIHSYPYLLETHSIPSIHCNNQLDCASYLVLRTIHDVGSACYNTVSLELTVMFFVCCVFSYTTHISSCSYMAGVSRGTTSGKTLCCEFSYTTLYVYLY